MKLASAMEYERQRQMLLLEDKMERRKKMRERALHQNRDLLDLQERFQMNVQNAAQLRSLDDNSEINKALNEWKERLTDMAQERGDNSNSSISIPDLLKRLSKLQKRLKELHSVKLSKLKSMIMDMIEIAKK
jgi:hypothetical protein